MIAFIPLERPFYSFCICMAVRVCKGLREPNIYYHSDCTCGPHMLTKVHEDVDLCINPVSYKQNVHLLALSVFGLYPSLKPVHLCHTNRIGSVNTA